MITRSKTRKERQTTELLEVSASPHILQRESCVNPNEKSESQFSDGNNNPIADPENSKKVTDQTWVQCENERCLKWRKISYKEASQLCESKQWFCSLNQDVLHNRCECPEETCDESGVGKYGYRYVYSQLPMGSLVWARMPGHVSWPAILCPAPEDNTYVSHDEEGDVLWYHVEFLGRRHSHYWVLYYNVEVYAKGMKPMKTQAFSVKGKKSTKKRKPFEKSCSQANGKALQEAVDEADRLVLESCSDRLSKCVYRYQEPQTQDKGNGIPDPKSDHQQKETSQDPTEKPTHVPKQRKRKLQKASASKSGCKLKDCADGSGGTKKKLTSHDIPQVNETQSEQEPGMVAESSLNIWSPSLSTLANSSKEETFTAAVLAWQVKAAAFQETVLNFMKTRAMPIKRLPFWHGVSVNLYQLYSAVQDGGGFHKVCISPGAWATVYKQSTGINTTRNSGAQTAKIYYQRNLLPYELYKAGKNYDIVMPDTSKSNGSTKSCMTSEEIKEIPFAVNQLKVTDSASLEDITSDAEEAMKEMEDIENMMTNFHSDAPLLRHSEPCNQLDRVVERVTSDPKSTPEAMKLRFYSGYYSDSSQVEDTQDERVQCVPDVFGNAQQCVADVSSGVYGNLCADEYLTEMEQTENQIDQLYDEMSQQWTVL